MNLPQSRLAIAAAAYSRRHCPDFLFNHCMRTFVFGALLLERRRVEYIAEDAFVICLFHDMGLLPEFETPRRSFEVDGANVAEQWVRENGGSASQASRVWYAVEMHDGNAAVSSRHGAEATLVSLGAGADVDGPDPGDLEPRQLQQVLAAFPRLQFKKRFTELIVGHCVRKPDSQGQTWLAGVCREHSPHPAPSDAVEQEIANAPFAE